MQFPVAQDLPHRARDKKGIRPPGPQRHSGCPSAESIPRHDTPSVPEGGNRPQEGFRRSGQILSVPVSGRRQRPAGTAISDDPPIPFVVTPQGVIFPILADPSPSKICPCGHTANMPCERPSLFTDTAHPQTPFSAHSRSPAAARAGVTASRGGLAFFYSPFDFLLLSFALPWLSPFVNKVRNPKHHTCHGKRREAVSHHQDSALTPASSQGCPRRSAPLLLLHINHVVVSTPNIHILCIVSLLAEPLPGDGGGRRS